MPQASAIAHILIHTRTERTADMKFKFNSSALVVAGALAATAFVSQDAHAGVECGGWNSAANNSGTFFQESCNDGANFIDNAWLGAFDIFTPGNAEFFNCNSSSCSPKTTYGGTWWTYVRVTCTNGNVDSGWVQGPSSNDVTCASGGAATGGWFWLYAN
jgi:hypothetical protein